jgi:hypothetical protein
MRRKLIFIILCGLAVITKGQDHFLEKSTYGIQTGTIGV